jgi:hypothetical protein
VREAARRPSVAPAGVLLPPAHTFLAAHLGQRWCDEGGLPVEAEPFAVAGKVKVVSGDVVTGDGLQRVTARMAHDVVSARDDQDLAHRRVDPGAVVEPIDGHVRFQRAGASVVTASTIGAHSRHHACSHRQRTDTP